MKPKLIVAAVILLLVVGFALWKILTPTPIFNGNGENINYGSSAGSEAVEGYRRDCLERGGVLNECGSSCASGEVCLSVCEFICELE